LTKSSVQITVLKESQPDALLGEVEAIVSQVRERAYQLYDARGHGSGRDWDDWLEAEHQVIWHPSADLTETEREYVLSVTVPGVEPGDIQVTGSPNEIAIRAESLHQVESGLRVHCQEFGGKRLFRRFELPGAVDPNRMTATLDKGILTVTAAKVTQAMARTDNAGVG